MKNSIFQFAKKIYLIGILICYLQEAGTQSLSAEFESGIIVGDDTAINPLEGTIRYNSHTGDFEGYTGTAWQSFTFNVDLWGLVINQINENFQITNPNILSSYTGDLDMHSDYFIAGGQSTAIYKRTGFGWELDTLLNPGLVNFGENVCINENFAIISSLDSFYIYKNQSATWTLDQRIGPPAPLDRILDVYLSTDLMILGTRRGAGIYKLSGGQWVLDETISPGDIIDSDDYGYSVAILDTVAIVGAVQQNGFDGAAYIYHDQNGTWNQVDKLSPDGVGDKQFAVSVELNAQGVFVGVRFALRLPSINQGQVSYYEFDGSSYIKQNEIIPETEYLSDEFSISMDLYEDQLIIGANGSVEGMGRGSAFLYSKLGGSWILQTQFLPSDTPGDSFGMNCATYQDWAIVGAATADKIYFISK